MKQIEQEQVWDKKKVIPALLSLAVILTLATYFGKNYLDFQNASNPSKQVMGAEQEDSVSVQKPDVQKIIQERVEVIKEETEKINVVEVATSSPQIQKIINDIRQLEEYPSNQAKDFCHQICEGI